MSFAWDQVIFLCNFYVANQIFQLFIFFGFSLYVLVDWFYCIYVTNEYFWRVKINGSRLCWEATCQG